MENGKFVMENGKFVVGLLLSVQMCAVAMEKYTGNKLHKKYKPDVAESVASEAQDRRDNRQLLMRKFGINSSEILKIGDYIKRINKGKKAEKKCREFVLNEIKKNTLDAFNDLEVHYSRGLYLPSIKPYQKSVRKLLNKSCLVGVQTKEHDPIAIAVRMHDLEWLCYLLSLNKQNKADITFTSKRYCSAFNLLIQMESSMQAREEFGYTHEELKELKMILLGYQPQVFSEEEQRAYEERKKVHEFFGYLPAGNKVIDSKKSMEFMERTSDKKLLAQFNSLGSDEFCEDDVFEESYSKPVRKLLKNPYLKVAQTKENDALVVAIAKKDFGLLYDLINRNNGNFKNPDITFESNDYPSALFMLRELGSNEDIRKEFGYTSGDVRRLKLALLTYQPSVFNAKEQKMLNDGKDNAWQKILFMQFSGEEPIGDIFSYNNRV